MSLKKAVLEGVGHGELGFVVGIPVLGAHKSL